MFGPNIRIDSSRHSIAILTPAQKPRGLASRICMESSRGVRNIRLIVDGQARSAHRGEFEARNPNVEGSTKPEVRNGFVLDASDFLRHSCFELHSTVTLLARFRGRSTLQPRKRATW